MQERQAPVSVLERDLTMEQLDAGKRASDLVNMLLLAKGFDNIRNCCIAIRMSDGSSDGVVYDNRTDAIRFQLHEQQCAYVYFRNLGPAGAKPVEMAIYLEFQRRAYAAGMRLIDPDNPHGDSGRELLMTTNWYDSMKRELRRRGMNR